MMRYLAFFIGILLVTIGYAQQSDFNTGLPFCNKLAQASYNDCLSNPSTPIACTRLNQAIMQSCDLNNNPIPQHLRCQEVNNSLTEYLLQYGMQKSNSMMVTNQVMKQCARLNNG